eukprot:gene21772-26340_t
MLFGKCNSGTGTGIRTISCSLHSVIPLLGVDMLGLIVSGVLHLVGLLLTFYTLCLLCDEHLIPTVEVFIKQFEIPEEVAAVTLVAFGSAAPELFLNSVSAVAKTSDLSLSAVLGSGMV